MSELETIDARDLMMPDSSKWICISNIVMSVGFPLCVHDGAAGKTKWNQLVPDYKHIVDYMGHSGQNVLDYWELSSTQRKQEGLPGYFPHDFSYALYEWFGSKPQMQTPHVQDLLSSVDTNFNPIQTEEQQGGEEADSDTEGHHPVGNNKGADSLPLDFRSPISSPNQSNRPIFFASRSSKEVRQSPAVLEASDNSLPMPFTVVPPMLIPVVISSYDTNDNAQQQRVDNIAVRRKHVSEHTVIVDATKAT